MSDTTKYTWSLGDEVRLFLDQGVIMLKAVSGSDPVELNADEARSLAAELVKLADNYDAT